MLFFFISFLDALTFNSGCAYMAETGRQKTTYLKHNTKMIIVVIIITMIIMITIAMYLPAFAAANVNSGVTKPIIFTTFNKLLEVIGLMRT